MNKKIMYAQPIPIRSIQDWYGPDATRKVLAVTDIIREDIKSTIPGARFFYETNVVREMDDDGIPTFERILSNRVEGCPTFYPIRKQPLVPNETDGYIAHTLPKDVVSVINHEDSFWTPDLDKIAQNERYDMAIDAPAHGEFEVTQDTVQEIISTQSLGTDKIDQFFGKTARILADSMQDYILENVSYFAPMRYMKRYYVYYMVMYEDYVARAEGRVGYAGIVYTNLLKGSPVFFPNENGQAYLDAQVKAMNHKGRIRLSPEAKAKIRTLMNDA